MSKEPIYTAAPPALSAEERKAADALLTHLALQGPDMEPGTRVLAVKLRNAMEAARAPVTPTPEPATVERCNHQRFKHVPSADLFCSMPKGHTGLHGWEGWTWPQDTDEGPTSLEAPASPPARPPAVEVPAYPQKDGAHCVACGAHRSHWAPRHKTRWEDEDTPARPPAVTREEFAILVRFVHSQAFPGGHFPQLVRAFNAMHAAIEDEARRDADRRGRE